jgi:hypothetical protein
MRVPTIEGGTVASRNFRDKRMRLLTLTSYCLQLKNACHARTLFRCLRRQHVPRLAGGFSFERRTMTFRARFVTIELPDGFIHFIQSVSIK